MNYRIDLSIPANTAENELVSSVRHVLPGLWTQYAPVLPIGCNDLVKWRLLIDENQVVPIEPGTWMLGNGVMGVFEQSIRIPAGGASIKLIACSPGTGYNHNIYVDVNVIVKDTSIEDVVKLLQSAFTLPESG